MCYLVCGDLCNCLNRIFAVVAGGIDCVAASMLLPRLLQRLLSMMAEVIDFAVVVRGVRLVPTIRLLKLEKIQDGIRTTIFFDAQFYSHVDDVDVPS